MNGVRVMGFATAIVIIIAGYWLGGGTPAEPPSLATAPEAATPTPEPPAVVAVEPAPSLKTDADFDYYVLVLSWSPTHCASDQGRGRDDDLQCRSGRPYGFVLHGLWPQHERGYPQDCPTEEPRRVADDILAEVLEISPSEQLVQHEWRKHGTCAGLSQADYFAAAATAFRSVAVPSAYRAPKSAVSTTPDDVRDAFLAANTGLVREAVAATCRRNDFAEVWVCLDKTLSPRACSKEVRARHCGDRRVRMRAVRGDWPR